MENYTFFINILIGISPLVSVKIGGKNWKMKNMELNVLEEEGKIWFHVLCSNV